MRKIYCDFCKKEIDTIFHEIKDDSKSYEICEECHKNILEKLENLLKEKCY